MEATFANGHSYGRATLVAAIIVVLEGLGCPCVQAGEPATRDTGPALLPAPAPGSTPADAPAKPDYEAATSPDQIGRIIVPVMVNSKGPFSFALDTGANRTVLSPRLAQALGLDVVADNRVTMNGTTGSAIVPTALVERCLLYTSRCV